MRTASQRSMQVKQLFLILTLLSCFNNQASAQGVDRNKTKDLSRQSVIYIVTKWQDVNNPENFCSEQVQGSGFIISGDGAVLSAMHNFEKTEELIEACDGFDRRVITAKIGYKASPREFILTLVAAPTTGSDIALLYLPETEVTYVPLPFCSYRDPDQVSQFYASGFPLNQDLAVVNADYQNREGPRKRWSYSSDFTHGMSGGPVIEADSGNVVGVVQGGKRNSPAVRWVVPLAHGVNEIDVSGIRLESCEQKKVCDARSDEIKLCVANRLEGQLRRNFRSPTASVRCPGGGCLFKSDDCNKRETHARYQVPGGWVIDAYNFVQGSTNDGITGNINVERNTSGEIIGLSTYLACKPSSRPGAGGGWNNGHFEGFERYLFADELTEQARVLCEQQICAEQ